MKAPAKFDRQWYYMVQDEARRVAREIVNQVVLGRERPEFIKVRLDEEISWNMSQADLDRFLNYFDCPGLYMTSPSGVRSYFVVVRSDLVKLSILAPIHKVRPIRVKHLSKI